MRRAILFALAAVTVAPFTFGSAQQIVSGSAAIVCPPLTMNLQLGSRDSTSNGQVTRLQMFLTEYYKLNPQDYVSGYFGILTRENVRRFQCQNLGVCSGSEATNGYGVVGPRTRNAIAQVCSASLSTTTAASPPSITQTTCTFNGRTLQNGAFATAFKTRSVPNGETCERETRYCHNGVLSGSYAYSSCAPRAAASCALEGFEYANGAVVTAYSAQTSANCDAIKATRTCSNNTWSGSNDYKYTSCTALTATYSQGSYYSEGSYYSQGSYASAAPVFDVTASTNRGVTNFTATLTFSSLPATIDHGVYPGTLVRYIELAGNYRVEFGASVSSVNTFAQKCTRNGSLEPGQNWDYYTYSCTNDFAGASGGSGSYAGTYTAHLYKDNVEIASDTYTVSGN